MKSINQALHKILQRHQQIIQILNKKGGAAGVSIVLSRT